MIAIFTDTICKPNHLLMKHVWWVAPNVFLRSRPLRGWSPLLAASVLSATCDAGISEIPTRDPLSELSSRFRDGCQAQPCPKNQQTWPPLAVEGALGEAQGRVDGWAAWTVRPRGPQQRILPALCALLLLTLVQRSLKLTLD